ncbi:MAG: hypothetical protein Q7S22_01555 [Candidatus Micrarchaeota archaeon]|nr:hypothetical protein [Candidatus Micrarchaeota archaeon]
MSVLTFSEATYGFFVRKLDRNVHPLAESRHEDLRVTMARGNNALLAKEIYYRKEELELNPEASEILKTFIFMPFRGKLPE